MNQFYSALTLLLVSCLPLACVSQGDQKPPENPALECRIILKHRSSDCKNQFVAPTVELKNVSQKAIDIIYRDNPILQYLTSEVREPDGTIVKHHCGDGGAFDPHGTVESLKPGQTIRVNHRIPGLGHKGPGIYRIQVQFEYQDLKAISPAVEIELKPVGLLFHK